MRMISPAALRSQYTPGTRVELLQMEDIQAPPVGTKGTVIGVDDTGSLMVRWDNGSGLNVLYGIDRSGLSPNKPKATLIGCTFQRGCLGHFNLLLGQRGKKFLPHLSIFFIKGWDFLTKQSLFCCLC